MLLKRFMSFKPILARAQCAFCPSFIAISISTSTIQTYKQHRSFGTSHPNMQHSSGLGTTHMQRLVNPRPVSPNIFIVGLPDGLSSKDLEDRLNEYGEIKMVKIFPSPPQYKSSSALICFRRINSALCAIDELNQTLVLGRRVTVEFSKHGSQQRGFPTKKKNPNNSTTPTAQQKPLAESVY